MQRIRSGLDDNPASSIPLKAPPAVAVASETKAQSILEEKAEFLERGGNSVFSDSPVKRDVVLRQRLKTAMGSAGG